MTEGIVAVYAYWLAVNIFFEARDQTIEGMIAVGHVTMNRVHERNMSVKSVVFQPNQFSWTREDDPQKKVIRILEDADAFEKCLIAAHTCLSHRLEGETLKGANHYFNPDVVLPGWAQHMTLIADIGNHRFYKG